MPFSQLWSGQGSGGFLLLALWSVKSWGPWALESCKGVLVIHLVSEAQLSGEQSLELLLTLRAAADTEGACRDRAQRDSQSAPCSSPGEEGENSGIRTLFQGRLMAASL